jgi:hypothetical protein
VSPPRYPRVVARCSDCKAEAISQRPGHPAVLDHRPDCRWADREEQEPRTGGPGLDERWAVLEVPCPVCDAPAGEPCRRPAASVPWVEGDVHPARVDAAERR